MISNKRVLYSVFSLVVVPSKSPFFVLCLACIRLELNEFQQLIDSFLFSFVNLFIRNASSPHPWFFIFTSSPCYVVHTIYIYILQYCKLNRKATSDTATRPTKAIPFHLTLSGYLKALNCLMRKFIAPFAGSGISNLLHFTLIPLKSHLLTASRRYPPC